MYKRQVDGATVIDTVKYSNLEVGKQYTLKAELVDKADESRVLGTGEETFKPEKASGSVDVRITVKDEVKEPVKAAVAFEKLTSVEVDKGGKDTPGASSENPNEIAEHRDIKDEDQTVYTEPSIKTEAKFADDSAHEVVDGATVIAVSYTHLTLPTTPYG